MAKLSFVAALAVLGAVNSVVAANGKWAQCGRLTSRWLILHGKGFTGQPGCGAGLACVVQNEWYAQCLDAPAASAPAPVTTSSTSSRAPVVTSRSSTALVTSTSTKAATTSAKLTSTSAAAAPPASTAGTPFLQGINLAGLDFGVDIWGSTPSINTWIPTEAGVEQVPHFTSQGVNIFRVPFAWQYMMSSPASTELKADFFARYDKVVQAALKGSTSPYVILDLHNYGMWEGQVVGTPRGPTSAQFANTWSLLAKKYAGEKRIMFGLMNEPHDLDINNFKLSLQAAVNAIRGAGARTQYILVPGGNWTPASGFITQNKAALKTITDPVGGTDLLVYDLHQYLNEDASGSGYECVTDRVNETFKPLAADLVKDGRKAIITEIGGTSSASCQKYLKSSLAFLKANSQAYLGYTVWSAGAFPSDYSLSIVPINGQDTVIWNAAVKPNLGSVKVKRHEERAVHKQRLQH